MWHVCFEINCFILLTLDFTTEIQRKISKLWYLPLNCCSHRETRSSVNFWKTEKIVKILKVKRILGNSSKYRVKSLSSALLWKFYCVWNVDYCAWWLRQSSMHLHHLVHVLAISLWPGKQNCSENKAEWRLPSSSRRYFAYKRCSK